ncbi:MAG TPA: flagellar basal-body rod protein FlgF [Pseudolabrys sp.]|nr:flagellar basal-body rod protein FlgF [Pseudolabrys sp.]
MQNAFLVGLSRQVALSRELDVVANNIANINTNGYKADGSLFEEYLASSARSDTGGRISFVRDRGIWHDMTSGAVERTGNPLDVAIDGEAFFAVQTQRGERYTRNGAFHLNATGQLVTSEGDAVLGTGGPITFQPNDREISISKDGIISVREGASKTSTQRGQLRLVNFTKPQQLQKDGGSTFKAAANDPPQQATKASIEQGAIEKSNVRGVVEMSRMIEITRSYTQVATLLQQQGDMNQQSIDKLAEVPA